MRQIAVIATRHGFGNMLERGGLWRKLGRKEAVEPTPESRRESTAKRFRGMLTELGPTFIKLGQVLSTRADLLPAEFIDELSTLQDAAPPIPLDQVHAQILRTLGKPTQELFATFDPAPLGSASIAQAHRAKLHSGEEVVVKIQRPGVEEQIRADLSVLHVLARALEAVFEEAGLYSPTGIISEFELAVLEELDFLHEANNLRTFEKNHRERPYVKIPRVYEELTGQAVLTMEYLRGPKISQVDLAQHDRHKLARNVIEGAFRQLFEDGLFHGDPHPGNILVLDDDVLGIIDFGLVGKITPQMQDALVQLVIAIVLKDAESVARLLYRVGTPDSRANLSAFTKDIQTLLGRYLPTTLGEIDARHLLRDLFDLAVRYRIRLPREYAILARAAIAIEGMLRTLAPDLNVGEVALPFAKELLAGRYDLSQLQGGLMRAMVRIQGVASELPMQLSQIMLDLESGKFSVTVRSEDLHELNANLRGLAMVGLVSMLACGFIIGAFISFSSQPWTIGGVPLLGILGTLAAGGLVGMALSWFVLSRAKKVSLKRLFGSPRPK